MARQNKKNFKSIVDSSIKRGTTPPNVYKSRTWYRKKARSLKEYRDDKPKNIIKMGDANKKTRASLKGRFHIGKLVMFNYEATTPGLKYYDRFPCAFPIQAHSDGFLGINMHYLPFNLRAILMDRLYDFSTLLDSSDDNDHINKLEFDNNDGYKDLNKIQKYRYFRPCIKKYLFNNVKSRYLIVPQNEWDIAIFLPLERFGTTKRQTVWTDSREKII